MIDMHDYNRPAKAVWLTSVFLGLIALASCLYELRSLPSSQWLVLALGIAGALTAGWFPVRYPNAKWCYSAGDIFIFLVWSLVSPAAGVVVAAMENAVGTLRASKRATSRIGGPLLTALCMSLAAFLYGAMTQWLTGAMGLSEQIAQLVALCASATVFGVMQSALIDLIFQLKKTARFSVSQWWNQDHWIHALVAVSAVLAGLVALTTETIGIVAFMVAVPTVVLIVSSLHFYFDNVTVNVQKLQESTQHLQALARSEQRFHQMFDQSASGLALIDEQLGFVHVNATLNKALQIETGDPRYSRLTALLDEPVRQSFVEQFDAWREDHKQALQQDMQLCSAAGEKRWFDVTLSRFDSGQSQTPQFILQATDITSRKASEGQLSYLAFHDPLTGLANRAALLDALGRAFDQSRRGLEPGFAVMMLDFDRFKLVNDTLGHAAGDELLTKVAQRLRAQVRSDDLVARFGGDEFSILVRHVEHEQTALDLATRVLRAVAEPLILAGLETSITASIGVTFSRYGYGSAHDMLRDADVAMYEAKRGKLGLPVVFSSSMQEKASSIFRVEADLRRALRDGQFALHFQPIWCCRQQRICGYEALVRWQHPMRGTVSPDVFIPVAESTGLILPIGRWIVKEAVRLAPQILGQIAQGDGVVSINISPMQLREEGFAGWICDLVTNAGLRTEQFSLEITEAIFSQGQDQIRTLQQLRDAGFAVALDDFGTGYSSLSYLQRVPASTIKLDLSFTQSMLQNPKTLEIARTVVALAKALGMGVCAEGVETAAQLEAVGALGVDTAQGYLIGRAQPAETLQVNTPLALINSGAAITPGKPDVHLKEVLLRRV